MTIAKRRALIRARNNLPLYLGTLLAIAAGVIAVEHLVELGIQLAALRVTGGL